MAISFSRPDPASPSAVGAASFSPARRGFDQGEVRDFLRMVAAELARLQEREKFLESELRSMQTRGMSLPGRLDEETVTTLLGEEAARVLTTARDAGVQIRERAEESATRMVKEATEDASRMREAAMLDADMIREEATREAEAEIELAKQQGRDMVMEAREYREKVLSELSRRRDAARNQIEQLLHGRERLLNSFERSRIAVEDVLQNLTEAHDEPEPFINLAPTTGPIPVVTNERVAVPPRHPVTVADTPNVAPDHPSLSGPAIYDVAAEQSSVPSRVHEPVTVLEDIVEHQSVDEVVVIDMPDGPTIEELEQLEVEESAEQAATDMVEDVAGDSADTVDTIEESRENIAPVVALFGGDRRPAPVIEAPEHPSNDHADDHAASTAVDDIFAKLRAATTTSVSKAAEKKRTVEVTPVTAPTPATTVTPVTPVVDKKKFTNRDAALKTTITAMARKLKRTFADEQNDVLDHVNQKRSSLDIDAVMGALADHVARHGAPLGDDAMTAATEGAKSMKSARGSVKRVTSAAVGESLNQSLEASLVAPMREAIAAAIAAGGKNRTAIADEIRRIYREWKSRLDDVATDVACATHSKGAFMSLEPGTRVCWMVDPNGPACADAEDNSLAGFVTCGEPFPTGDEHPLGHPGCRCLLSPAQH